jgi:hypothetical protein
MTQQHINDTNKEMRVLGENLTAITKEFTIQYQNMLTQIAKLKGIIEQQSR